MEHVNTLRAYKDLLASGVSETQAEAQVNLLNSSLDSMGNLLNSSLDRMATKDDLRNLEKHLTSEIAHLRWLIIGIGTICALPILKGVLKFIPYFSSL